MMEARDLYVHKTWVESSASLSLLSFHCPPPSLVAHPPPSAFVTLLPSYVRLLYRYYRRYSLLIGAE